MTKAKEGDLYIQMKKVKGNLYKSVGIYYYNGEKWILKIKRNKNNECIFKAFDTDFCLNFKANKQS